MRSRQEVELVLELATAGESASAIARRTGIPRTTVRDWLRGLLPRRAAPAGRPAVPPAAYSHLLGLYLGDGHIVRLRRTFMLRIFFDARYPGLIGEAVQSVRSVGPRQRMTVFRQKSTNCVVLRSCWNAWPLLFPQHGAGMKHERRIELEPWQLAITHAYPRELIRGLINSDGRRHLNRIRYRDRRYAYPRYEFSNRSQHIHAIFGAHLDLLGIAWRRSSRFHTSISRREAVAALDEFVGPKR